MTWVTAAHSPLSNLILGIKLIKEGWSTSIPTEQQLPVSDRALQKENKQTKTVECVWDSGEVGEERFILRDWLT